MKVKHTLKPIYNELSKVLILGSMPSAISRENNFYYAHNYTILSSKNQTLCKIILIYNLNTIITFN